MQFGLVVLFASTVPSTAVLAFVANVFSETTVQADHFLCRQRCPIQVMSKYAFTITVTSYIFAAGGGDWALERHVTADGVVFDHHQWDVVGAQLLLAVHLLQCRLRCKGMKK